VVAGAISRSIRFAFSAELFARDIERGLARMRPDAVASD